MTEDGKMLIHQIHAEHSNTSAQRQSSAAFYGLHPVINLARGCKIMVARNVAYLYGIANGLEATGRSLKRSLWRCQTAAARLSIPLNPSGCHCCRRAARKMEQG